MNSVCSTRIHFSDNPTSRDLIALLCTFLLLAPPTRSIVRRNRSEMTQIHRIPVMIPLAVGVFTFACTIFVHVLPVGTSVTVFRRKKRLGLAGESFWGEFVIVASIILLSLVAHLIEIALWAAVFMICGEFHEFGTAYYHSAGNYTTLGYGDLIMSPEWRLLGPLEAANGVLMFGLSTAIIFTLMLRLTQARFVDLKD